MPRKKLRAETPKELAARKRASRYGKYGNRKNGEPWPRRWIPHFLKALQTTQGQKTVACHLARVSSSTLHRWEHRDEEFREAVEEIIDGRHAFDAQAFDEHKRRLALAILERAVEGVRRRVLHQGEQVVIDGEPLWETEYTPSREIFAAKAVLGWSEDPDKGRAGSTPEELAEAIHAAARAMGEATLTEPEEAQGEPPAA